ncbi:MAG: ABC-2 type transport system ATP-binding protein [Paracoccaceae bacterium]|jgi:ABC-2 type transport system ATP-binding protein
MQNYRSIRAVAILTAIAAISACHDSSSSSGSSSPATESTTSTAATPPAPLPRVLQCAEAERLPASLLTADALEKVTNALPNIYDTDHYQQDSQEIDTTSFDVSIALPERCPGDRFPVVIHSHGYGGEVSNKLDENGTVEATKFFPQILELFQTLPHHGYVAVSFDQRGHGESQPDNGGGLSRVMDPQAETQDAIRLLDWLAENADRFHIYREDNGVANDFRVGLLGYSYGGGWQFPIALLDKRIDTIVPSGTWHSLINSLMPGDAVKLSFNGLLCLFADGTDGPHDPGVTNTEAVAQMCNLIGYKSPQANLVRTKEDLMGAIEVLGFDADTVLQMFNRQVRHFQDQNGVGPWCDTDRPGCTDQSTFVARSVPTLLLQGNRDVMFNMTEAYWNYQFFNSIRDDNTKVAVLTSEGGHMNPLDHLFEGSADCGGLVGTEVVKAWFDYHLKGETTSTLDAVPNVCISVADTESAHTAQSQGMLFNYFPVGSQPEANGGVVVRLGSGETSVGMSQASYQNAEFLEVFTVPQDAGDNYVLAGIPTIDALTIKNTDDQNPIKAVAFIGVGIQRDGSNILVDAEVTGLVQNPDPNVPYTSNPNVGNDKFLLPGVGERLKPGDKVGLFFYQRHVQFSAVINGASASGVTTLLQTAGGTQFPDPIASAFNEEDSALNLPNPHTVTVSGVELPVFDLRKLPAGTLSLGPEPQPIAPSVPF